MLNKDTVSVSRTYLGAQIREVSQITGVPIEIVSQVVRTYLSVLIVEFVKTGRISVKNLFSGSFTEFKSRGGVKAPDTAERPYFKCSITVKRLRKKYVEGEINNLSASNLEEYHNRFSSRVFSEDYSNGKKTEGGFLRDAQSDMDERAGEFLRLKFDQ